MKRRGIAANSAFALGADLAGKVSTVAVTVVAARTLTTRDFALLATCLAAASLLTSALDAGAQTLLTRDGAAGPDERGSLFRALALGRLPLAAVGLIATIVVGTVLGRPLDALLAFALAAVLAAGLSLSGLLRSAQDLRPEAEWKLLAGALSAAAFVPTALLTRNPALLLAALAAANLLGLWPVVRASRTAASFRQHKPPLRAVRKAVPLGLLSLATIAYYRSGVIALSILGTSKETAAYAIAANVAFGLLAVPNAITTGLLPRLAAERSDETRAAVARRALGWTVVLAGGLVAATAVAGPTVLGLVFGHRYATASTPLVLLSAGVLLIAVSGVLGTVLIALKTLRPLAAQVAVSLAVNLAAVAVLAPVYGAVGAALATIACEVVGLAVLVRVCVRRQAGLLRLRWPLPATATRQQ